MDLSIKVESGWKLPGFDSDLTTIAGLTCVTLGSVYLPVINETPLRSALGLLMVLFIPGYALIAVLFPGNKGLDGITRAGLSFGLSIVATPLIGLGLNYTPWGICLDQVMVCFAVFSLACCAAANVRRHNLRPEDRFSVDFKNTFRNVRRELFHGDKSRIDKALSIFLLLCIVASFAALAYVIIAPKAGESSTQFYILGPDGKADNYPARFHLGDSKPVIVGIVNNEYRDMTYDLVVTLNDSSKASRIYTDRITLANNQSMEKQINLTPDRTGTNMKAEFLLYANGNTTVPYKELYLWINVTE